MHQLNLPHTLLCAECSKELGNVIYAMVWRGTLQEHCSIRCKNIHKAKLQAEQNMEEAHGR